jgi:hypothetical protein
MVSDDVYDEVCFSTIVLLFCYVDISSKFCVSLCFTGELVFAAIVVDFAIFKVY